MPFERNRRELNPDLRRMFEGDAGGRGGPVDSSEQPFREMFNEVAFTLELLDAVDALIVVLDQEGKIVEFNRSCERLTGYSSSEVIGRRISEFLLAHDEAEHFERVHRSLLTERLPIFVVPNPECGATFSMRIPCKSWRIGEHRLQLTPR